MKRSALRLAGAALLVVLGMGAGAWLRSTHPKRLASPGVRVPAGEASTPNSADGVASSDLPLSAGVLPPSKIPDRLPEFSLGNRAGKLTSIGDFAGKSLVLNFWATWCGPCKREIPLLQALHFEWAGRNVEVVGIAVDYREKVLEFADNLKITYPLLIGEQDALDTAAALGVTTPVFPFSVFTDRKGDVVALYVGELHRPQAELILSVVQKLDQGTLQLGEARRNISQGLNALTPEQSG